MCGKHEKLSRQHEHQKRHADKKKATKAKTRVSAHDYDVLMARALRLIPKMGRFTGNKLARRMGISMSVGYKLTKMLIKDRKVKVGGKGARGRWLEAV